MRYDLVFEGGGARGVVFLGALQELERAGHTWGRLLGTSAGAIVAALLAAGYRVNEMLVALNEKVEGVPVFQTFLATPAPFSKEEIQNSTLRAFFRDIDWAFVPDSIEDQLDAALIEGLLRFPANRHLMAYLERGGWFAAEPFVAWLQGKLDGGNFQGKPRQFGGATLRQLHEATGSELTVVASDTTAARMRVLNHRTAPNCPVLWAVRMSMNLPFVWPDVVWQQSWGLYLGTSLAGHVMVDGGLLSSFPLELYVSDEPYVRALMGTESSEGLLGLLIDESLPVPNDADDAAALPSALDLGSIKAVERIARMVNTMTSARDQMVLEAFESNVVRLPARGYGTIEFNMSDARRERLIEGGRQAMRAWLANPRPSGPVGGRGIDGDALERINRRAAGHFSQ